MIPNAIEVDDGTRPVTATVTSATSDATGEVQSTARLVQSVAVEPLDLYKEEEPLEVDRDFDPRECLVILVLLPPDAPRVAPVGRSPPRELLRYGLVG